MGTLRAMADIQPRVFDGEVFVPRRLTKTQRNILVALAAEGGRIELEAVPAVERLRRDLETSSETVRVNLRRLQRAGLVAVDRDAVVLEIPVDAVRQSVDG